MEDKEQHRENQRYILNLRVTKLKTGQLADVLNYCECPEFWWPLVEEMLQRKQIPKAGFIAKRSDKGWRVLYYGPNYWHVSGGNCVSKSSAYGPGFAVCKVFVEVNNEENKKS